MSELDDLLSRLKSLPKPEQAATFDGRALSRDDKHLHLAIATGVIAIPLADIDSVRLLTASSNDIVSVDVRHADRIQYVRRVSPMRRGPGGLGGFGGVFNSGDTHTGQYLDSSTVTGGRADATDDAIWIEEVDDQPA